MYLSTVINSIASSFFTQPTNSTRFSTHISPTIPSLIKASTEHRQADIYPQDIAIDMSLEEKSDDLIDLIAKFESMQIVDEIDWDAFKPRTDNHQADAFPQDIAIDRNTEEKVDEMDWKAL